jgi:hypothetical protein
VNWSADGKALYVFRHGEVPARLQRLDLESGRKQPWKAFVPSDGTGVMHVCPIVLTPDLKGYAYTYIRVLSDLFLVTGI